MSTAPYRMAYVLSCDCCLQTDELHTDVDDVAVETAANAGWAIVGGWQLCRECAAQDRGSHCDRCYRHDGTLDQT